MRMETMIERVGCSWRSESQSTFLARERSPSTARWHDTHEEDLRKCDAWLCVCGETDPRGGPCEPADPEGRVMEPADGWSGHILCTSCGRLYDRDGLRVDCRSA